MFQASKQANGFKLLNHAQASKQASKRIFAKTDLTKIPSLKQALPVRGIPYVHGGVRISYMHFRFARSVNLVHASCI